MKRALVFVPIILLIVLNACGPSQSEVQAMIIAGVGTLTATNMPRPPATPTPNTLPILYSLTSTDPFGGGIDYYKFLDSRLNELEDTMGADFKIFDVQFPQEKGGLVFQISTVCECANGGSCCSIEHMFVLTMGKLYTAYQRDPSSITAWLPGTPDELEVVCWDHNKKMGSMVAAWTDVQSFLTGNLAPIQFGRRVKRK